MKIGTYGNPETTCGGLALKYYASIRLNLRKKKNLEEKQIPVAVVIKSVCIKNKVSDPFREAEFEIWFDGRVK